MQERIVCHCRDSGLDVEPPIVSRLYQELSEGMHAFNQAKKISTIPFPFPYAQTVTFMLFAFTVTLPVLMVAMVSSPFMAGLLSGVTIWSYLALNEVPY
jgi:predicted membrane chloride channel (bestrophin family)